MPEVGTGYDITFDYSVRGQVMSSTTSWRETTSITDAQPAADIAFRFSQVFANPLRAIMADDVVLESIRVSCFNPPGTIIPAKAILGITPGSAGTAIPHTTAAIMLVATSDGSSRNNNRIFFGGIAQEDTQGNQLTAAALDGTYLALRDLFDTPLVVADGELSIAAKVSQINNAPVDPPIASLSPLIQWRATLKNQRSRTSKRTGLGA